MDSKLNTSQSQPGIARDVSSTQNTSTSEPSRSPPPPESSRSGQRTPRPTNRVRFTSSTQAMDESNHRFSLPMAGPPESPHTGLPALPPHAISLARPPLAGFESTREAKDHLAEGQFTDETQNLFTSIPLSKAIEEDNEAESSTRRSSLERIVHFAKSSVGYNRSTQNSETTTPNLSPTLRGLNGAQAVPLLPLHRQDAEAMDANEGEKPRSIVPDLPEDVKNEVRNLVRSHTRKIGGSVTYNARPESYVPAQAGTITPVAEQRGEDYVPRPEMFRSGILSQLLRLHAQDASAGNASTPPSRLQSRQSSPSRSGTSTPRWYQNAHQSSTASLLASASSTLGAAHAGVNAEPRRPRIKSRSASGNIIQSTLVRIFGTRTDEQAHISLNIAETLLRHKYLLRLSETLITFGAATHRVEDQLIASARSLEIPASFQYFPHFIQVNFSDPATHTSETHVVQGILGYVNMSKLEDVYEVYKEVIHDVSDLENGIKRLETLLTSPNLYGKWTLVIVTAFANMFVAPLFGARWIDLPISFTIGLLFGIHIQIVSRISNSFIYLMEVIGIIGTSFLARAFGSIAGGNIFCYSAIAQSSIALILPGYTILCGVLELQAKKLLAGSVRLVWAVLYCLFIAFSMAVGPTIYGALDKNATSATTCQRPIDIHWKFVFIPPFALCLCILNQARWKQVHTQILIATIGFAVNFFAGEKFANSALPEIASLLAALAVGLLGNIYSRLFHRNAFSAMLPAIWILVPSGIASQGSLNYGLQAANSIINGNGTETAGSSNADYNGVIASLSFGMLRLALGLTLGLFLAAAIVYPGGKKRSGLFSF